jgi:hypothetical protein
MRDDIRFLQELEGDLLTVTRARNERPDSTERRRTIGRGLWAGVAAAVLAVSFALGSFVQNSAVLPAALNESSPGGVGSAAQVPAPNRLALTPNLNQGSANFYRRNAQLASGAATSSDGTAGYAAPNAPAAQGDAQVKESAAPTTQTDLSKIIRDGAIAVTVPTDSFNEQAAKVVGIANQNGGSVLSSTTQSGTSGTFTLRIPASRFDKAMLQLRSLGSVDSSSVQGKDVTADYMDAKAHLKIYLTHRKFLYGLMAKATTTGEALALEHQLQQTQLQIDQITGQIRYLDNQVAEATLRVDLHEPGSEPKTASDIENPSLGNAFSRAIQGFLNVIAVMLIGFGYLIPLLVIAAVAYAIVRLVQRRRTAA